MAKLSYTDWENTVDMAGLEAAVNVHLPIQANANAALQQMRGEVPESPSTVTMQIMYAAYLTIPEA